jgi:hypothetical protein
MVKNSCLQRITKMNKTEDDELDTQGLSEDELRKVAGMYCHVRGSVGRGCRCTDSWRSLPVWLSVVKLFKPYVAQFFFFTKDASCQCCKP